MFIVDYNKGVEHEKDFVFHHHGYGSLLFHEQFGLCRQRQGGAEPLYGRAVHVRWRQPGEVHQRQHGGIPGAD